MNAIYLLSSGFLQHAKASSACLRRILRGV